MLQLDHEGKTSIKVPGIKGGSARYYVFTDEALYKAQGAANDEEEAKAAWYAAPAALEAQPPSYKLLHFSWK